MLRGLLVPASVALAMHVAGCSSPPGRTYDVVIDPEFSAPEATYAVDALHAWQTILGGRLELSSVTTGACSGAEHQICIHAASHAEIISVGGEASTVARTLRSESSDRADVYILSSADPPATVTRTIAHELGHAMALEHTQRGTLMCFDTRCAAWAPTCDDVAQWESVRGGSSAGVGCPDGGTFVYSGQ